MSVRDNCGLVFAFVAMNTIVQNMQQQMNRIEERQQDILEYYYRSGHFPRRDPPV